MLIHLFISSWKGNRWIERKRGEGGQGGGKRNTREGSWQRSSWPIDVCLIIRCDTAWRNTPAEAAHDMPARIPRGSPPIESLPIESPPSTGSLATCWRDRASPENLHPSRMISTSKTNWPKKRGRGGELIKICYRVREMSQVASRRGWERRREEEDGLMRIIPRKSFGILGDFFCVNQFHRSIARGSQVIFRAHL